MGLVTSSGSLGLLLPPLFLLILYGIIAQQMGGGVEISIEDSVYCRYFPSHSHDFHALLVEHLGQQEKSHSFDKIFLEKCLYCHNFIIPNHPEIRKEHKYFDTKTPTPWKKVFYVPEHVMFNHERHIKKEIACEACHGDVAGTDRLKRHEFKMGFCIQCHRKEKANLDCWLSCHN